VRGKKETPAGEDEGLIQTEHSMLDDKSKDGKKAAQESFERKIGG
jgi:hypothetical protein